MPPASGSTIVSETIVWTNIKYQIAIAVPLLSPTSEGLTTNEEEEKLWKLEDMLEAILKELLVVLSIPTNGMREFVFYSKEWHPEFLEQEVKNVSVETDHKLQFMMQPDKKWETYNEFKQRNI